MTRVYVVSGSARPPQSQRLHAFFGEWRRLSHSEEALATPSPAAGVTAQRAMAMFDALSAPLAQARQAGAFIDAWAVAGLRRNELRNAAVLAWLLDPRGSHGFGAAMLRSLIAKVRVAGASFDIADAALARATVMTEERPLGSDRDRVDISIEGDGFVLFIEVKVDALEGHQQLERYCEAASAKAAATQRSCAYVLFLSPRPPRSIGLPNLAALTWADVASVLDGCCAGRSSAELGTILVRQFARHIRTF